MEECKLLIENRDSFIEENKSFIYSTALRICKRSLSWNNDDELSIALLAFNKACDSYLSEKGDFYSFSSVIIRNALIDFFRKEGQRPYLTFDEGSNELQYMDYKNSLKEYEIVRENHSRAEEIALFNEELRKYKLSFSTLAESCPSHRDTRNTLLNIAYIGSSSSKIIATIRDKKRLPIKELSLLTGSNTKLIEKWRKYILALIILFSSEEYPYIKSYLDIKVGENND